MSVAAQIVAVVAVAWMVTVAIAAAVDELWHRSTH